MRGSDGEYPLNGVTHDKNGRKQLPVSPLHAITLAQSKKKVTDKYSFNWDEKVIEPGIGDVTDVCEVAARSIGSYDK